MQGDARREDAYAAALGGERADALVTDPPYCLLTRRRKHGDLRDPHAGRKIDREPVLRFESVRDYRAFTEEWLPRAVSHLRPGAPLAVWTNFLGEEPISTAARGLGYQVAGEFVWAKQTTEHDGNEQLLRVYETALIFLREPLPPLGPERIDPRRGLPARAARCVPRDRARVGPPCERTTSRRQPPPIGRRCALEIVGGATLFRARTSGLVSALADPAPAE